MSHSYVWIMYDMIHMNVSRHTRESRNDDMSHISVIYMTWFKYVWHEPLVRMNYVWHDSYECVASHTRVTEWWHEPHICHIYDMIQICVTWATRTYELCMTWFIWMCRVTHASHGMMTWATYLSYIWHDSNMLDMRHSHIWIMCDMIHMNVSRHTCESRTHMRASCHALWMHHVIHMNGFCHTWTQVIERDFLRGSWAWNGSILHPCEYVMSLLWVFVTHMNEPHHTYECATSHIWMGHITHMNTGYYFFRKLSEKSESIAHIRMRHVTHMSHVTHINESRHKHINWVMSYM